MSNKTIAKFSVFVIFTAAINILFSACAAVAVFLFRSLVTGSSRFYFMVWNLVLSLLSLAAASVFVTFWTQAKSGLAWVAFIVWLFLLPNTFYMLTDFVHVQDTGDINMLFDIVMIGFFAMNGFIHGLLSLYLVHINLLSKYSRRAVGIGMAGVLLVSSFAVDMGRYLRWNSWDVILHPKTLLFDTTNTLLSPASYHRSFLITGVFFVVTGSLYAVVWQLAKVQSHKR